MSKISPLQVLTTYIAQEVLEGNDVGLRSDTPLLEIGVLNSLEVMRLVSFIERRFAVLVPPEKIQASELRDLSAISQMVTDLMNASSANGPAIVGDNNSPGLG